MIPRYSRPEMAAIWAPENVFRIMFEIEAHACDALAEAGVIPAEAAKAVRERGGKPYTPERIARIEGQLPHLATTADLRQQVAEVKEQIAQIKSQLPHLATKADLQEQIGEVKDQVGEVKDQAAEIKAQVARIEGQLPHLATKADLADATTRLERAVRRQTYWLAGTMIAVGGLVFAAIKLL